MTRDRPHAAGDLAEPHSNLRLVDDWVCVVEQAPAGDGAAAAWTVLDASGSRQGLTGSRAEAVRLMSRLALRERSVLPLKVIDGEGRPTGDRLA